MKTFKKYAEYYDTIYQEKDYNLEVKFIERVIKRYSPVKVKTILSLGCGTASHDIILSKRGFDILGVDISGQMLKIAREKALKEKIKISFEEADITKFRTTRKFDFAMAMFNVVGYMVENRQIKNMIKSVDQALKKGGLFVFDCWYGPAVLRDGPKNTRRQIGNIERFNKARLLTEKNIIEINMRVRESRKATIKELHKMRYWFLPELEHLFSDSGIEIIKVCNFLDLDSEVLESKWNISVICQKK